MNTNLISPLRNSYLFFIWFCLAFCTACTPQPEPTLLPSPEHSHDALGDHDVVSTSDTLSNTPLEPKGSLLGLIFESRDGWDVTVSSIIITDDHPMLTPIFKFKQHPLSYRYLISPNGKYIAVREENVITIYDLFLETEITRLDSGSMPTNEFVSEQVENDMIWSPTSNQLAFVISKPFLQTDIMVYDLKTQQVISITDDLSRKSGPTWSQDGKHLAFAILESCGKPLTECDLDQVNWHIGISDVEGASYEIISDETMLPTSAWHISSLCQISWSPDGRYVVYKSFCPSDGIPTHAEIFVTATDGSNTAQITQFGNIDYANYYTVNWSNDNQYMLIGYAHDFLFDNLNDRRGYLVLSIGKWQNPEELLFPTVNPSTSKWGTQQEYVIGTTTDYQNRFIAEWQQEQITVLFEHLPLVSLNGLWMTKGYVTQMGNRLVMLIPNTGEIVDLNIPLNVNMVLRGWWVSE